MDIISEIKSGKYNYKYIALRLYPDKADNVAMATFSNKINGTQNRKFTQSEIDQIKIILK